MSFSNYTPNNSGHASFSTTPVPVTPTTNSQPAHFTSILSTTNFDQPLSSPHVGRGRPRGSTGAKRGRKPKGTLPGLSSPRSFLTNSFNSGATSTPSSFVTNSNANAQYPRVHWAMPNTSSTASDDAGGTSTSGAVASGSGTAASLSTLVGLSSLTLGQSSISNAVIDPALIGLGVGTGQRSAADTDIAAGLVLPRSIPPAPLMGRLTTFGGDDEAEGDDEWLPAMADDDYSAQLSWQSQSKDNLKVLMDNLSPAQYERFEAYRRHALPKQAVRKVIQQSLGQQVSQPVAQIIAGFAKVFVGEMVEKARAVQSRRGETGPLSPDHLREAYKAYQEETGRVGAARPIRAKKLFVR